MDYAEIENLIAKAYSGFNRRDIDAVLILMHPDVHWPNGWEGGYVEGHDAVRNYWTRQWSEINPNVSPERVTQLPDGRVEVWVRQIVKDQQGNLLVDGNIKHVYTLDSGLLKSMEIVDEK
jgi:hypothetical protein